MNLQKSRIWIIVQKKKRMTEVIREIYFQQQLLLNGINADLFARFAVALKFNGTVDKSEESIIGADADIVAGMDFGASLSDEDVACENELTVSSLGAESLGFGITAVTGWTHTFFMRKKLKINLKHS